MAQDIFDETFEAFLAQQAAEYQRRLELTMEAGMEKLGYVRVVEEVPQEVDALAGQWLEGRADTLRKVN
jgi:hypothetical protein